MDPIQSYLDRLHARHAALCDGSVATYIPELAKADPDWFSICLTTSDGKVYETGDSSQLFTIQSISKPFVYGLALEDNGRDAVLQKIGVEPTGDAFNSISLAPDTGAPLNPMINAGAIAATSMIAGRSTADKLFRLVSVLSLYAGRSLEIDQAVFESERSTGHRNRAIGHMLRNFDIIESDPEPALDLYFQQCSLAVTCRDLSLMGATLANRGINPLTGERAVSTEYVDNILSVMTSCGMYDYAGEWLYWVGMPAKSGVAGGVVAVLPGQLGIGVFSPRLDARGNSVRGVAVCKEISRDFRLHAFRVARSSMATIRASYDLAGVGSKRLRSESERDLLDHHGRRVKVFELQGDLGFAGIESIVRRLVKAREGVDHAVIDLKRVTHVDESSLTILLDLLDDLERDDKHLIFANAGAHARFIRLVEERLSAGGGEQRLRAFPDLDRAIEWCEDRLLEGVGSQPPAEPIELSGHQLCRGMAPAQIERLQGMLERQRFERGEVIVRRGDDADKMYLLVQGEVSVTVDLPNGQLKRLSTCSAGMCFGELAFIGGGTRTADVRAGRFVDCFALTRAAFDQLAASDPEINILILRNLLGQAARMVGRLNQEVASLSS